MSPYEYETPPQVESNSTQRPLTVKIIALLCVLNFLWSLLNSGSFILTAFIQPQYAFIPWEFIVLGLARASLALIAGATLYFMRRQAMWWFALLFFWHLVGAIIFISLWTLIWLFAALAALGYSSYLNQQDRMH